MTMIQNNRWLLPEGVEEILPRQAWQIDHFQRKALDLYSSWGYELIMPPLIEYSESLLIATGSDMDLQTFKLTDQLSGRTLAIRADITPQTARIDAHSWRQEGPSRFCYCAPVVRTKPKTQLSSRLPVELGAELYGDSSIASDQEVIHLMLTTLQLSSVKKIHLDLGHIGIYRGLADAAGLSDELRAQLTDAFGRKARSEVESFLAQYVSDKALAQMIAGLIDLNGDASVLVQAKEQLQAAPANVQNALHELTELAQWVQAKFPEIAIVIDLAELRAYQYHTGFVFAAYIDGVGHSVANGGRFDGIGKAFGRMRPATGFSVNINSLLPHILEQKEQSLILAPALDDALLEQKITELRAQGSRVVRELKGCEVPSHCKEQLVLVDKQWQVQPL